MSPNQSSISDFSEYYRWSQRTKIKYKLHYGWCKECYPDFLFPEKTYIFQKSVLQLAVSKPSSKSKPSLKLKDGDIFMSCKIILTSSIQLLMFPKFSSKPKEFSHLCWHP